MKIKEIKWAKSKNAQSRIYPVLYEGTVVGIEKPVVDIWWYPKTKAYESLVLSKFSVEDGFCTLKHAKQWSENEFKKIASSFMENK